MTAQMHSEWIEGDLSFDFSKAQSVRKLDKEGSEGHGLSHLLKSVDFVVEWSDYLWLIEIKDPENGMIPDNCKEKEQKKFRHKLQSDELINNDLFPKLRDSLIYLSLDQGVVDKAMRYITLIGLSSLQPAELFGLQHKLWHTDWVKGPKRGWKKAFEVHFMTVQQWNRALPQCPIIRKSEKNT
ncbi:hypothetical protein BDD26_1455 [Xenorhabdus cabanillasii]|uniref:Uncharacterized protein n=1 Tax=Xenorhabdus cabanillasii TaxID=351673 RepID=A0A3D9UPZ5_9GAMM|nr:hypothetical protein [Xenorhabdus cabanillasii]REF26771.1 hypothetical protein BDD26_1455 [Xenorhabdus cabanillasii]